MALVGLVPTSPLTQTQKSTISVGIYSFMANAHPDIDFTEGEVKEIVYKSVRKMEEERCSQLIIGQKDVQPK